MKTIKRNGENFAKEIQNVGETLHFEGSGCKCVVLKYYKSQPKTEEEKKARPLGGNKTQVTLKWENGNEESYNTDELRAKHCPDYVTKPHVPQVFRFEVKNLELATDEELAELAKQIKELQEERKQATKRKADVEKKLGVKLTEEQYKAMQLVGLA
jgi:hypothetical protein